ncbi:MAG: site-specific DNA-methyltransferase, partial [Tissierellia bacterium]|nr:site-specific DNA-methyltransferase [Tissierellia bacterium]
MMIFLDEIQKEHDDEKSLRALNKIKNYITEKKYGLIWEEHSEKVDEMLKCNIPIFREVENNKIVNNEKDPFNFLLEGDNLHSLYLLEKTHREKIDVIYIDPPYNTGKKDFIYNDNYIDSDDGFRHSKWLSFMNRRLLISKRLLKEDGIIAISIDENEIGQLKILCDEIFGEKNRLSTHHIQVRYSNKSLNEDNDWQPVMEYVLIYAKNKDDFIANKPFESYDLSKFKYEIKELTEGETVEIDNRKVTIFKDEEWEINEIDGHIDGLKETWASGSLIRQSGTAAEFMAKHLIKRKEIDGLNVLYKIHGMGTEGDGLGYRYVSGPKRANAIRGKFYTGVPIFRREELEKGVSNKTRPISNYLDYSADFGNIRHEGGIPFNSGKKPIKMIKEIINYHKRKDIVVLDFFAGSGSTGHAVEQLNAETGGSRKYILCTNNENQICEKITYKRLGNIQKELPHNLKYYKTDFIPKTNKEEESIKEQMLETIKTLIELENHIEIDNTNNIIINDEELLRDYLNNALDGINIYITSDIMLSQEEKAIADRKNIKLIEIPEYYYSSELRE